MKITWKAAVIAGAALFGLHQPAMGSILYDNGADNGGGGDFISSGGAISDSFTLLSSSILTGVNFGASGFQNTTITALDWAITTSPSTFPSSGTTASVTTNSVVGTFANESGTFQTMLDSFSLPSVNLAAGTYYLVLQNATGGNAADHFFWDASDGSGGSSASRIPPGGSTPSNISSESFQILGIPAAATPLPAALPLFATGLGAFGLIGWRRKKKKTAAMAVA